MDSFVHTHEAPSLLYADQFATGLVLGPPVAAVVTFVGLLKVTVMFNHGNAPLPLGAERVRVFDLNDKHTEEEGEAMSTVTILAKQPPGGRCSLYLRYAQAINQALGLATEVHYGDEGALAAAPAMLIGDRLITPADGVIVSPEDIALSFGDCLREDEVVELRRLLEVTQEQWMEEMSQA